MNRYEAREAFVAIFPIILTLFFILGVALPECFPQGGKAVRAEYLGFDALAHRMFEGAQPIDAAGDYESAGEIRSRGDSMAAAQ